MGAEDRRKVPVESSFLLFKSRRGHRAVYRKGSSSNMLAQMD